MSFLSAILTIEDALLDALLVVLSLVLVDSLDSKYTEGLFLGSGFVLLFSEISSSLCFASHSGI